ncbi:MAG: YmfQ family protein [Treponema sp.]|nr:YmfQ family protein [Treponema sp.]
MGINIASEKEYSNAVRELFPKGEYWDKQFSDPESDINLYCKAKAAEIIHLRKRMNDLLAESNSNTSTETIGDWERVLIGHMNLQLSLFERREKLRVQKDSSINRLIIIDTAKSYGFRIIDIVFPYKASFFGFSKFGLSMFSRPVFFSVFFIIAEFLNDDLKNTAKERINDLSETSFIKQSFPGCYEGRFFSGIKALEDFEETVNGRLLSGNIVFFQYKLEV